MLILHIFQDIRNYYIYNIYENYMTTLISVRDFYIIKAYKFIF
jgi:hypothetical protein